MNRYLTILAAALSRPPALLHAGLILVALTGLPEVAQAASGPIVAGADALHKAARRGSGKGKPASRPGGGSKPASKPAAEPKPASKPASQPAQPASSHGGAGREPSRSQPADNRGESRSGAQQAPARGPQPVSGPRTVDFGNPGGAEARPGSAVGPGGSGSAAPSNFRGGTPVSRGPGDQSQNERRSSGDHGSDNHRPASYTAHDHRDAAYASHATAARSTSRHRAAASRSSSYRQSHRAAAYHSDYSAARRHYAWYQPGGWFVRWQPGRAHYWYHGVFVYGPPPGSPPPPKGHPRANLPERHADHAGDLSLGLRAGSLGSGYVDAPGYSDFGLGLAARYRLNDPLGIEVQWLYHDDTWQEGTERIEQPFSASLELFAIPWAKVNPYLLGGVSVTKRNFQDHTAGGFLDTETAVWGPHVGLGLEFNLGKSTSLSFDGRYLSYLNVQPDDPSRHGALQGNMGLNFYF